MSSKELKLFRKNTFTNIKNNEWEAAEENCNLGLEQSSKDIQLLCAQAAIFLHKNDFISAELFLSEARKLISPTDIKKHYKYIHCFRIFDITFTEKDIEILQNYQLLRKRRTTLRKELKKALKEV